MPVKLVYSAICLECDETPPEGVDPDKWADKHTRLKPKHGTISSGRPA